MGILIYCKVCGNKNPESVLKCRGKIRSGPRRGKPCNSRNIQKEKEKIYWIEYRTKDGNARKRQLVGTSREEAVLRLAKISNGIDDEYSNKSDQLKVGDLFKWFMSLRHVKNMDSVPRMRTQINALSRLLNTKKKVVDLTLDDLDDYIENRLNEESPNRPGNKIAPKTCKEELNLLRNMINRAFHYERISRIPIQRFPKMPSDNVRQRIFTEEEFRRIVNSAPTFMMRIIIMAQGTGMRENEIVCLEWHSVDLDGGFVRLGQHETKNNKARLIRLPPHVIAMLREIPRFNHTNRVFLSSNNKPIPYFHTYCRKIWKETLKRAKIEGATFHDLRHDFVTKAMRNGNQSWVVMKQVGHETESMLRRYQLIEEKDLMTLKMSNPLRRKHRAKNG